MVVENFSVDKVVQTICEMKTNYDTFRQMALLVGNKDFSGARMIEEYCLLYQKILD